MGDLKSRTEKVIKDDRLEAGEFFLEDEKVENLWHNLVLNAYQRLKEPNYSLWMFLVGTSGNTKDRLKKGQFHLYKLL